MTERELLSQLNNLRDIKPDYKWKKESREILLSQISEGYSLTSATSSEQTVKFTISHYLRNFFHQPVLVVIAILLVVLGGGIFSLNAAQDTKPGDSLYIAKIISEKAQLAITFDEEEKAKLGIEFASNRAKEITQILSDVDNEEEKTAKVEKLARNFKKEINTVKTRLKKINIINEEVSKETKETEEDSQIFSADLGREDNGMQIYNPQQDKSNQTENTEAPDELAEDIVVTTPDTIIEASSTIGVSNDIGKALEEAEQLFAEQDYNGTLDKLEEAINQINDSGGEVKGESESASTTIKNNTE
jgi:hypothetical protein